MSLKEQHNVRTYVRMYVCAYARADMGTQMNVYEHHETSISFYENHENQLKRYETHMKTHALCMKHHKTICV